MCMGVHGGVWWRRGWQKEHVLSWHVVLMIGCMYDWVHVSCVFKKILGIVMILWLLFSISNL